MLINFVQSFSFMSFHGIIELIRNGNSAESTFSQFLIDSFQFLPEIRKFSFLYHKLNRKQTCHFKAV